MVFLLPKNLGSYKGEEVEVSNGRFGPYVRHGSVFVSLPKGENPLDVSIERAKELIDEKAQADAPIASYKGEPVMSQLILVIGRRVWYLVVSLSPWRSHVVVLAYEKILRWVTLASDTDAHMVVVYGTGLHITGLCQWCHKR